MVCGAVCGAARESQTSGGVLDLCLPSTDERTTREIDINSLLFRLVIFFFSPINYSHTRVLLHQTRRAFQTFPVLLSHVNFSCSAPLRVCLFFIIKLCVCTHLVIFISMHISLSSYLYFIILSLLSSKSMRLETCACYFVSDSPNFLSFYGSAHGSHPVENHTEPHHCPRK